MKGRWKALLFGAVWVVMGYFLARPGWGAVFAEAVPRPPSGWELMTIFAGGILIVIGLVLGLTPHLLWLLRTFYKEDFAPGASCPVMVVCPGCHGYNNRGRRACAYCTCSLSGARSVGGQPDFTGDEPKTTSQPGAGGQ